MLESYFKNGAINTDQKTQRLLAVQAALEIAKAAVAKSGSSENHHQVKTDIEDISKSISSLADAIQEALKK